MKLAEGGPAPVAPGLSPTWTSSDKDRVITALGASRLWAAIGHGILNEVYWPTTGQPQVRDLGFIVAGEDFWVEVKRERRYTMSTPKPYVPLPQVVHEHDRYRLSLEFLPDPDRDVLLIRSVLEGEGVQLYPLLAPHLGTSGQHNTAWVDDSLYASGAGHTLCLASDPPFARASAGYVGASDGWQDFAQNARMSWQFSQAGPGNVALMAELPAGEATLALAFAESPEGARTLALSSLAEGFAHVRQYFIEGWEEWGSELRLPAPDSELGDAGRLSAAVLKVHEDRTFPGGIVASLSIPWGTRGDDPGGYHLVWTRDAVEAGFGLLAAGRIADVEHLLAYLAATQAPDGSWAQNFFPDGRPYWTGTQLDEVGFPILLAAKLEEVGHRTDSAIREMARRAAGFLARRGPVSPQDRWEENPGAGPFTLAVEVSALVAAAEHFLVGCERSYSLALADVWNARIEEWTYATGTDIAHRLGVDGYYIRISPPAEDCGWRGRLEVRNRVDASVPAESMVGLDFIYLARLGLRSPTDPRLVSSLRVADALLRVETPLGPAYHRYNGDGYGEHQDGRPFDGTGVGRAWPLLTGERGVMALLQGQDPLPYLKAMAAMTGACGLIPEQVWDADPIRALGLEPGRPTGSAMPLVWAHAEFLKLLVARDQRRPVELLDAVAQRYAGGVPEPQDMYWRDEIPIEALAARSSLVVEDRQPFLLHFGFDGWQSAADIDSQPSAFGMHAARLDRILFNGREHLDFTRLHLAGRRWEGTDHRVRLRPASSSG